ncbi:MAG TPA: tetratricopeptide repeat protein [Terriglobales bacterium]
MRYLRFIFVLLLTSLAAAQTATTPGRTILIIPFDNVSKAPGIEWVGDSFPELLQERLDSPSLYVLSREDRIRAYDRVGIPMELHPSRATIYRVAEQLDVDYVLLGSYTFDGREFQTTGQLLDMRRQHLLPATTESGALTDLIKVETALAWDVLHALRPDNAIAREAFVSLAPPIRLDAFQHYIRGIVAASAADQIQQFHEALRLSPSYPEASLRLGKVYYGDHQYEQAVTALARVPSSSPLAREANFYLGLAAYGHGDYARAETAFSFVAARLPLAEVYNNLGVVISHRDKKTALEYFRKAVNEDPTNPDYHFNLGIELYQQNDAANATRQLRECLSLWPQDTEARSLLESVSAQGPPAVQSASATAKIPAQRLHTTYDESSFRQLDLSIENAAEQRLSKADLRTHAQFHADRGRQLLQQGFTVEAEREFREAISLNASNADAHAGLGDILEANGDVAGARLEAEQALRLRQFAEPLLVLARLDLRDNKRDAASEEVDRALKLEPTNGAALELKRTIAAKLAQEAQPLPRP